MRAWYTSWNRVQSNIQSNCKIYFNNQNDSVVNWVTFSHVEPKQISSYNRKSWQLLFLWYQSDWQSLAKATHCSLSYILYIMWLSFFNVPFNFTSFCNAVCYTDSTIRSTSYSTFTHHNHWPGTLNHWPVPDCPHLPPIQVSLVNISDLVWIVKFSCCHIHQ